MGVTKCTVQLRAPRHIKALVTILLLLSAVGQVPSFARRNPAGNVYGVSLPQFTMSPQEAIVGVEYDLTAAVITSVRNIRGCWDVHIRNGDELKDQLDAEALFLSAGIRRSDLSYLKNFISIREDEPESGAHIFDITVKLTITDKQWEKVRYVAFSKAQLALAPVNSVRDPAQ